MKIRLFRDIPYNPYLSMIRLTEQHHFMTKHAFSNRLIYDISVELSTNSRVLDAGTGNGAHDDIQRFILNDLVAL